MAVTVIPNVTNWTVTPQNGQAGYFTLMNTWLGQSTSVIASLQTAITAQNTANSEINALAIQVANDAIIATGLANYQGSWSNSITYSKGQSVSVSGLYYISKVDSNLNHLVSDTNYWLYNPINNKIDKITTPLTNALAKIQADGTIVNTNIINDANGFVGIGTSTPSRKLEVQSFGVAPQSGIIRASGVSSAGAITNSALYELSITGAGGGIVTQSFYARYNNGYEIATYFADRFALRDNATNTERFAMDSAGNIFVPSAYSNTTASSANMFVDSTGKFYRSTSSKKYKTNIEPIDISYIDTFFNYARPIYYKSLSENDNPNWGYWGFIAEEIAEFDKRLVHWRYQTKDIEIEKEILIPTTNEIKDDEGNVLVEAQESKIEKYNVIEQVKDESKPLVPEGVMYERITVLLTAKVQEQKKIIDSLIARIEKLEINK